jgi:protein TonB
VTATTHPSAVITAGDRLGLTLFLSVVLHGIVILGIVFTANLPPKSETNPTLEIILTQTSTPKKIIDPDYLAPSNQDGGGNSQKHIRPATASTAPAASPLPGQSDTLNPPHQTTPPRNTQNAEVLTAKQSAAWTVANSEKRTELQREMPSAAELMRRSKEIAKLSADLHESIAAYTRRPRERFVSARSQSFRDAAYVEAWQNKIERIGNLNYPEEAKLQNLSGSLILDVAINANGTVESIELRRSSGYKLLDDAAIRIVKLAAPFSPFSPEMRNDTDILHITRTWQFQDDHSFTSGM